MNLKQSNEMNAMDNKMSMGMEMASASSDFFKAVNRDNDRRMDKKVDTKIEIKSVQDKKEDVKPVEVKAPEVKSNEGGMSGFMIFLIICCILLLISSSIGAYFYMSGAPLPAKVSSLLKKK